MHSTFPLTAITAFTALCRLGASTSTNGFDPWPNGIPEVPESCVDVLNPSDTCTKALQAAASDDVLVLGGYWAFEKHVTTEQRKAITRAGLDAHHLAEDAFLYWDSNTRNKAAATYYMGPNWEDYADRIQGNLGRTIDWKHKGLSSGSTYIIISTNDPIGSCKRTKDLGGYAWSKKGWFGYYDYINLCSIFFSLPTLDQKLEEILEWERKEEKQYLTAMKYYTTTGQLLLHEMLHNHYIGDPPIVDLFIPTGGSRKAYGPKLVHKLASISQGEGGGANASSVNADSYAMLSNAIYWMQLNGEVFPGAPTVLSLDFKDYIADAEQTFDGMIVHLGQLNNSGEVAATFNETMKGYNITEYAVENFVFTIELLALIAANGTDVDGGQLKCAWKMLPSNSSDRSITPAKTKADIDSFCHGIDDSVIFKSSGGTPLQAQQFAGADSVSISASWVGGQDCPSLDFSQASARSTCISRLSVLVNDCDKDKNDNDPWKGSASYTKDCIEWSAMIV